LLDGTNKDTVELIKAIKGKYKLYILSNNNPISLNLLGEELAKEGLDIDETFEKKFCSFQLKTQKPGKEIYLKALEGIGCDPSEILFIDDSPANLKTAQELGIQTLRYYQDLDIRKSFVF
jgi:putative hydrolase of the HAD superfamily